ncbi:MAG: hypothetical protein V1816_04960 [Pseudomonadota bacterium]
MQRKEPAAPAEIEETGDGRFLLRFSPESLQPSLDQTARYFGGARYKPSGGVRARIEQGLAQSRDLVAPRAAVRLVPAQGLDETGGLRLAGERVFPLSFPEGEPLPLGLAVVLATLGGDLETFCRELAHRNKIFESTLHDAAAAAFLDSLAEACLGQVDILAGRRGLFPGRRLSPGCDGFPLERQADLFDLVGPQPLGVVLNESFVMLPVKSISWLNILADVPGGSRCGKKCSRCALKNCQFRQGPNAGDDLKEVG